MQPQEGLESKRCQSATPFGGLSESIGPLCTSDSLFLGDWQPERSEHL